MNRNEVITTCRHYALAGAISGLIAVGLGLLAMGQLGFGFEAPWAFLGVGRLDAAYRQAMSLGAVSLPAAGFLLLLADLDRSPRALSRARWGLWIWIAGLCLAVAGILLGWMRPDAWAAAPLAANTLILLGAAAWASAMWTGLSRSAEALSLSAAMGLTAAVALLMQLALGILLVLATRGAGQSLAAASMMRGVPMLWSLPASLAIAAVLLPGALGRPLFGRRLAVFGLWGWMAFAALSLPRELSPELLPDWLSRPVEAASILALAPALALTALFAGAFIGSVSRTRWPHLGADSSLARRWWTRLMLTGLSLVLIEMLLDSSLTPATRLGLQFTSWSPRVAILPPPDGAWLMSVAAVWVLSTSERQGQDRFHWLLLPLAMGSALLGRLALAPLGLSEAAFGGSADLLVAGSLLRLPGLVLMLPASLFLLRLVWKALVDEAPDDLRMPSPGPTFGGATAWLATALALLGATAFLTSLVPLADPELSVATPRSIVRVAEPGSLRAEGEAIYVSEGCVICHSQRVRDASDAAYGLPTQRGDYGDGPAPVGFLRAGPDLAWAGDKFGDDELLAERLGIHSAGGSPAFPWLFERAGPLPAGRALVEYLDGLRSRPRQAQERSR